VSSKDRVITVNAQNLTDAARLSASTNQVSAAARGYLLTASDRYLETLRGASEEFEAILARLRSNVMSETSRQSLDRLAQLHVEYTTLLDRLVAARKSGADVAVIAEQFESDVRPRREAIKTNIAGFISHEEALLETEKRASTTMASSAMAFLAGVSTVTLLALALIAVALTRSLTRQVGAAVQRVRSSSAELEATAGQQAAGSREQAAATTQVTTTVKELLTTSRQIAESTGRVARMMEETSSTARTGEQTVRKGQEAVDGIRRQVEAIVTHMLDLGRKSQQIGNILEIINEMAEQTNILAINASIEAAGAGDSGKRFAVVADEIRNLADRVARSTRDIRTLIEETRAAANTTVMATEDGSKAVESGTRQFSEVSDAFQQIRTLVETSMEAAREIELGTRQQTTAVEQVNVAIGSVAQAAKESESGARQTFTTSSELASLSKDLMRLIKAAAEA